MEHEKLVEAASDAIVEVFGDSSVDVGTTIGSLEELRDAIDLLLETLEQGEG